MTTTVEGMPTMRMPAETGRLPRWRRLGEEAVPMDLQPRDLEILRLVYDYRFLRSTEIVALAPGSDQVILRRLQKLFHSGYLERVKISQNDPIVYGLGNKGAAVLANQQGVALGRLDWAKKNREAGEHYLDHTLQISRFRTTLTLAIARVGVRIQSWRREGDLKDAVQVEERAGRVRVPIIPDGFFVIEDKGELLFFFLEADRSTMTSRRFLQKMRAYWTYWKQGRHRSLYPGMEAFRVITVTKSEDRAENLRKVTRSADDRGVGSPMFWFTSERQFDLEKPETILEPIFRTPKDDTPHGLLE